MIVISSSSAVVQNTVHRHRCVAKRTSCSAFPITSSYLEKGHVSAPDFASFVIDSNSRVETSCNRAGLYFGDKRGEIRRSDCAAGGLLRDRASISSSSGRFFTSPKSVDRL